MKETGFSANLFFLPIEIIRLGHEQILGKGFCWKSQTWFRKWSPSQRFLLAEESRTAIENIRSKGPEDAGTAKREKAILLKSWCCAVGVFWVNFIFPIPRISKCRRMVLSPEKLIYSGACWSSSFNFFKQCLKMHLIGSRVNFLVLLMRFGSFTRWARDRRVLRRLGWSC